MPKERSILTGWKILLAAAVMAAIGPAYAMDGTASMSEPTATAKTAYAIVYRAGPNWKAGLPMEKQGLRDHFFYLRGLHDEGRLQLAGPLGADGGLALIWARDRAEAEGVIAADPAVRAGIFTATAGSFTPRFVGKEPLSAIAP